MWFNAFTQDMQINSWDAQNKQKIELHRIKLR